jgi:radical SAM superfamily enzyme YgiQ (UPF0313 family)
VNKQLKVLITTAPIEVLHVPGGLNNHTIDRTDTYQQWTQAVDEKYQLRIGCPPVGLRFLKENIPQIDILEYPRWDQYREALTMGYDIVGISFMTCTTHIIREMVDMAREAGAREVWGGNHGVLNPSVSHLFDRTFTGSGEKVLAELLDGKPIREIKHPVIISDLKFRSFVSKVGYLYTKRGCNMGCSFCSTPVYLPKEDPLPMKEIEKVLDVYREEKVANVVIYDETFLSDLKFSLAVAEALAKRELPWVCLTRADRLKGKISQLVDLYMDGAVVGIESFREANLQTIEKRQKAKNIEKIINEMVSHGLRTVGTYMICYDEDTAEVIYRDVERLSTLGLFLAQVSVLTPFPGTPLWDQLEDRIVDNDWNHFDIYHLVWDHPHISPEEARDLLAYAQTKINNPFKYYRQLRPAGRTDQKRLRLQGKATNETPARLTDLQN